MKKHRQRRGSVLMEFIIVFPIYLILFAGTVMIGDMLIHSNRLVSADRVLAFEVDGHGGGTVSRTAGWNRLINSVFHPGQEIADDGTDQDSIRKTALGLYAESDVTGPWTVCAAVAAVDRYKPLAGGTLGQLLAAPVLLGGTVRNNPFSGYVAGMDMRSSESLFGGAENTVLFTLKRRDLYNQRNHRRFGTNKYIDADWRNWRDRSRDCVARLLCGGKDHEYWRDHVASDRQWHSESSIRERHTRCSDDLPHVTLKDYQRYDPFVRLSE